MRFLRIPINAPETHWRPLHVPSLCTTDSEGLLWVLLFVLWGFMGELVCKDRASDYAVVLDLLGGPLMLSE